MLYSLVERGLFKMPNSDTPTFDAYVYQIQIPRMERCGECFGLGYRIISSQENQELLHTHCVRCGGLGRRLDMIEDAGPFSEQPSLCFKEKLIVLVAIRRLRWRGLGPRTIRGIGLTLSALSSALRKKNKEKEALRVDEAREWFVTASTHIIHARRD